MYVIVCMRPGISEVVSLVSRYLDDLGEGHWRAMKWILQYVHSAHFRCWLGFLVG